MGYDTPRQIFSESIVKSNQILIALSRWIWHQTEFRLVPNKSEKCNYNPN